MRDFSQERARVAARRDEKRRRGKRVHKVHGRRGNSQAKGMHPDSLLELLRLAPKSRKRDRTYRGPWGTTRCGRMFI